MYPTPFPETVSVNFFENGHQKESQWKKTQKSRQDNKIILRVQIQRVEQKIHGFSKS